MNLEYLTKVLLPKRKQEIKEHKNLATAQPIYVVYSLVEQVCSEHDDFIGSPNLKGKSKEFGFIDMGEYCEEREFCQTDEGMEKPQAVTRFWIDGLVAFFLTSDSAHAYLKYQGHNMHEPYVYVHYSGYANMEMDALLNGG